LLAAINVTTITTKPEAKGNGMRTNDYLREEHDYEQ
jgi:hypothetical protein